MPKRIRELEKMLEIAGCRFRMGDTVRAYTEKPAVVEAIKWTSKNKKELLEFLGEGNYYWRDKAPWGRVKKRRWK